MNADNIIRELQEDRRRLRAIIEISQREIDDLKATVAWQSAHIEMAWKHAMSDDPS
jgi:hypothetical protein